MIRLLWAVHNHQPVGNFDFVFRRVYERAYRPFLDVLKAHPRIRLSVHYSGILIDWLDAHHPEYLREVRELCEAGRVEVLGGAYYEPILPMLTEADRVGQIAALSRRIRGVFGAAPRGMWLAERVWEPSLVSSIAAAGIEYTVLDGTHFKMVGKTDGDLNGFFETEDQGASLKLLPIHDTVRDAIPFHSVEDAVAMLRAMNAASHAQVVFGDDGEKFGEWPGTFDTVYTNGWLDRFFTAVEAEPEVFAVCPLREGIDGGAGLGLVYLPPASYREMMSWAQNPPDIPRFRAARQTLRDAGRGEDADRFVHGGFWRNFLVKYPESNRLHKQALRLSREVEGAGLPPAAARRARDHVWQGQCNCAYWHGVFGGLYLPHLRFALYRHLIAAQSILDGKALARRSHAWHTSDWNFDGRPGHLLKTRALLLSFTAAGSVDQLWLKRAGINLCDTLTRRPEAYHARIASGNGEGTRLEEQVAAKEAGLEAFLVYDKRVRETLTEWALPPGTPFAAYRRQSFEPVLEFGFGSPKLGRNKRGPEARYAAVSALSGGGELETGKTFTVDREGRWMEVRWDFRARGGGTRFRFVTESLFCLLAGNAPDRYLTWKENGAESEGDTHRDILASHGEMRGCEAAEIVDEWLGFRCVMTAPGATVFWRDAIETVSQSEGGYERVYQGSVLAPVLDVSLGEGETAEFGLRMTFEEETLHAQQAT